MLGREGMLLDWGSLLRGSTIPYFLLFNITLTFLILLSSVTKSAIIITRDSSFVNYDRTKSDNAFVICHNLLYNPLM